ncbi:hypothetical protein PSI9734_01447 [Pseudidiomarina piscicola]|uniref:Negative regulator of flagellin synthesis n=1 Tax=Pseudidiomarina piscicola TaxID=2614830 RepID=A0A6S6WLU4_9GAMM|nr:flagellar biosynthesis anti-sigma factor FlgM [Pseudidiomarina piscicola]CAB0151029.1 hypothetical protein PSI9734_01447 [Pseudidiomarina piscicola]VZT40540.1 hypothetical protein PSI9734_01447 [Pseudomonas aeruginosa]
MKINGLNTPNNLNQVDQKRDAQPSKAADTKASTSAEVVTHLEAMPTNDSMDINQVRVDELREAIREGKLAVRADKIADALLSEMTDEGEL